MSNSEVEVVKTKPPRLTRGMKEFLRHRPYHTTDAAAARAAGISPNTVRSTFKGNKDLAQRELFMTEYTTVMERMERDSQAVVDTTYDEVVHKELRPLALNRYREVLERPITPDTTAAEMGKIKEAAKDVLKSTGDLSEGDKLTDISMVLQSFVFGTDRPSWTQVSSEAVLEPELSVLPTETSFRPIPEPQ